MSTLQIYKKNQGKYTRWITFAALVGLAVIGAGRLSDVLGGYTDNIFYQYGIPTVLVVVVTWLAFWFVNRPKSADFLIATEGEMKKVSWSSKKEIIGSTKVVIVFTFLIAAILFGVDLIFMRLFELIGVLPTAN